MRDDRQIVLEFQGVRVFTFVYISINYLNYSVCQCRT